MLANILLLLTAAIWGLGFVAQVLGMNYMGPFAFIGVRFLLGALSLLPIVWFFWRRGDIKEFSTKSLVVASISVGVVLFLAGAFQQVGIVHSNASNAAFITGLFACQWMIKLVRNAQLKYFSYYCFAVGAIAIGLQF